MSMAISRGRLALSSARFIARPAAPRDVSVLEQCLEASMRETLLKLLIAPYLKTADSSAVTAAESPTCLQPRSTRPRASLPEIDVGEPSQRCDGMALNATAAHRYGGTESVACRDDGKGVRASRRQIHL